MSIYISCPYDSRHKDIARNVFVTLTNGGLKTFYNGDIPEDRRIDRPFAGALCAAIRRCPVFIPIVCKEFGQGRLDICSDELAVANSYEKFIVPVLVDPHYDGVKPGGLLTGIRVADVSSPAKYETELPKLIRTIQAMISAARATGSAAGNEEDSDTESTGNDDDASESGSTASDEDASETGLTESDEDAETNSKEKDLAPAACGINKDLEKEEPHNHDSSCLLFGFHQCFPNFEGNLITFHEFLISLCSCPGVVITF